MMDSPVTPGEELRDAVVGLTFSLEKLLELLEVLACSADRPQEQRPTT
jgi:hypothetical protein